MATYIVEDTSGARLQAGPEGVKDFVESRYGLTMHWGLYSINGRGEWVMHNERIPLEIYRRRLGQFNPARFDAEEWADLLVESGLKFLLITAKHHDGFCLWDAAGTDFKVTNTPFRRDILAELAPALAARGLRLHFYYSLLDWTHPAYRNDWPAYVAYYQGQLRELLTGYGKIAGVVFDGYWPRTVFDASSAHFAAGGSWDLAGTYDLIHTLQPDAVVGNNHHVPPLRGEDYQPWELDMPGENRIGFNTIEVGDKPTVAWWNLNAGWAYEPRKHNVKRPDDVLPFIYRAAAMKAVFFLNVGPRPWGDIHPEEASALRAIGRALRDRR